MTTIKFHLSLHNAINFSTYATQALNDIHFHQAHMPDCKERIETARDWLTQALKNLEQFEAELRADVITINELTEP